MKTPNAKTRATDPCTSQWAAQTVRTRQQMYHLLNTLRILTKNEPCSGYTDEYIYAENIRRYNDTPQGLRSRRADAVKLGLVEMADRLGETETGRACKRWKLTNKGKIAAEHVYAEITKMFYNVEF